MTFLEVTLTEGQTELLQKELSLLKNKDESTIGARRFKNRNILVFYLNLSVLSIFWWIFNDNVENQDLYSKKDDLKKIETKNSYFLI